MFLKQRGEQEILRSGLSRFAKQAELESRLIALEEKVRKLEGGK